MKRIKARIKQFFHCLWGVIRLKPHQGTEIEEIVDGKLTYLYIGCSCGRQFHEEGEETFDFDEFDRLMRKEFSKYDH